MAFSDIETSLFGSQPTEVYTFTQGQNVWRTTSAKRPFLRTNGYTYEPAALKRSNITLATDHEQAQITIDCPADFPVAELFAGHRRPDSVGVLVERVHKSAADSVVVFSGQIVQCTFKNAEAEILCHPINRIMKRRLLRMSYSTNCNHSLYDEGCGLDPVDFSDNITILDVFDGGSQIAIHFSDFSRSANDYLFGPVIVQGEHKMVVKVRISSVDTNIYLLDLMSPASFKPGDQGIIAMGCDRSLDMCSTRFNNAKNMIAFPRMPLANPFSGSLK